MKTTQIKPLKNNTAETAKATVVIDFGNGEVKVMAQMPKTTKWRRYHFPSYVAEVEATSSQALTVISDTGLKSFLVGAVAKDYPNARTGVNAEKKAEFSNVLFLHALRQVFGIPTDTVHCDLIFTAPSVATYGEEMIARLCKCHHVQIPASQYVPGSVIQNYVVEVHRAVPMLEGHLGYTAAAKHLTAPIWVIDVGNRTSIATLVAPDGDILQRRPFDESGVWAIADRLVSAEILPLKTPSTQQVIDYLFTADASVSETIAPAITASVTDLLTFIGNSSADRYLIGGGAQLPGIETVLGAKSVKDPQWANVKAIAELAEEILV